MEKADVIKVRNILKAGKNWPLIVYIDNTFRLIDESTKYQFVKWDDENGILYNYALTEPIKERSPSNIGGTVSLFAVAYEHIQSMEVARMTIPQLKESLDSLGCVSDEWKERIIDRFKSALNPNIVNLGPTDINKAHGVIDGQKAVNDNDDYYNGRFTQNFAETRAKAEYNAYVEKVNAKNKTEDEESNINEIKDETSNVEEVLIDETSNVEDTVVEETIVPETEVDETSNTEK